MSSKKGSDGVGALIFVWVVLCVISGRSFLGSIFLVFGIFWVIPSVWDNIISKTFDGRMVKVLMFIATLCILFAIYCCF